MTMVPAQTLSKQQQQQHHLFYGGDGYVGCGGGFGGAAYEDSFGVMSRLQGYEEYCLLGSDQYQYNMAEPEDESTTNSLTEAAASTSKENNHNNNNNNNNNNINNSSIQEGEERDEGWLQLSVGGRVTTSQESKHHDHQLHQELVVDPTARRGGLVELDLLPGSTSRTTSSSQQGRPLSAPIFHEFRAPSSRPMMTSFTITTTTTTNSLLFQHQAGSSSSTYPQHQQEINWTFRPIMPHNIITCQSSLSSSSSSLMPLGSYFSRPFHQVHSGILDVGGAGPSSDFRVIDPPRRPHSGIWFTLQASQNQAQEPFLPQISKSYLRIKDGRMTVRLLMKYLVNKLKLDSESEVEITCRGQQLLPFLTLQHVRDNIWSRRDAITLLPDSSTSDHVMVLHYGRTAHDQK